MTFELRVSSVNIKIVDKRRVHAAMAKRYRQIVLGTFGANGQNRPTVWAPLSRDYAKQVARKGGVPVPTLYRRGTIFRSVGEFASESRGTVFTYNPIAAFHQFGTSKMPAREFFPFDRAGNPTSFAQSEMEKVVVNEITRES